MFIDHTTSKYIFNINFTFKIINREERTMIKYPVNMFGRNALYKDGSKTEHCTGVGVFCASINLEYSYPLGILIDCQAVFMAFKNPKVTSWLVWKCLEELRILALKNRLTLYWLLGIIWNEIADKCAKLGTSTHSLCQIQLWEYQKHC